VQLDWLREYLTKKSDEVLNEKIQQQLKALGSVQSRYISNEIQNFMSLVSSNKRSSEIFHNFNNEYLKNPFVETEPQIHSKYVNRTYTTGVYYSRNTISSEGWEIINQASCFNYFYPLMYRSEYLGYYSGYEIDEIYNGYPGRRRTRPYTPLVREWYYQAIQEVGYLIVTEPYVDFITRMFVITISQAIVDKENKPFGATALDVTLAEITKSISGMSILGNGFGILVSRAGMILTLPVYWKRQEQGDATVKIFDKANTGLDIKDWENLKNLTVGSTYSFVDPRKVSLVLIKHEIRPFFDNDNLTHYLFLCIEASELTKAKHYTIKAFDDTYDVLFWVSLSFGLAVFTVISVLIYVVTEKISIKFKIIEKIFGGIVNRALFYDTTKKVSFDEMKNNQNGMESLVDHSKKKIDHIQSLEKFYNQISYPKTRPDDVFIYEKVDECFYPFNYYDDKIMPWVKTLEVLRRGFE
jgi:hypothetical protein